MYTFQNQLQQGASCFFHGFKILPEDRRDSHEPCVWWNFVKYVSSTHAILWHTFQSESLVSLSLVPVQPFLGSLQESLACEAGLFILTYVFDHRLLPLNLGEVRKSTFLGISCRLLIILRFIQDITQAKVRVVQTHLLQLHLKFFHFLVTLLNFISCLNKVLGRVGIVDAFPARRAKY